MLLNLQQSLGWHVLPHLVFLLSLATVFCLIIRQNHRDLLELEGELAHGPAASG